MCILVLQTFGFVSLFTGCGKPIKMHNLTINSNRQTLFFYSFDKISQVSRVFTKSQKLRFNLKTAFVKHIRLCVMFYSRKATVTLLHAAFLFL